MSRSLVGGAYLLGSKVKEEEDPWCVKVILGCLASSGMVVNLLGW